MMGNQVLVFIQLEGLTHDMLYHAIPGTFVRPGTAVDLLELCEFPDLIWPKHKTIGTDHKAPDTINKFGTGHVRPNCVEWWSLRRGKLGGRPERCGIQCVILDWPGRQHLRWRVWWTQSGKM